MHEIYNVIPKDEVANVRTIYLKGSYPVIVYRDGNERPFSEVEYIAYKEIIKQEQAKDKQEVLNNSKKTKEKELSDYCKEKIYQRFSQADQNNATQLMLFFLISGESVDATSKAAFFATHVWINEMRKFTQEQIINIQKLEQIEAVMAVDVANLAWPKAPSEDEVANITDVFDSKSFLSETKAQRAGFLRKLFTKG